MSAEPSHGARLERLLEAAAEDRRETLAAARLEQDPPGAEHVAALVHARGAQARLRRARRRVLSLAALGAIAAAAVVALVLDLPSPPGAGADPGARSATLGAGLVEPVAPVGESPSFGAFAWRAPASSEAPGGWFEVRVSADRPGEGLPATLARSGRVTGTSWSPDPEEASAWPERIRWEVRAFDASGALLDAAEARAWRSSSP